MPVIQTLEGPRIVQHGGELLGFWQDLTDKISDAASSVGHIFYVQPQPKTNVQTIKRTGVKGLLGVFDPVTAHPLIFVLGIGAGIFLAARKKR